MAWVDVASEKPQIGVLIPSMIAVVPEPLGGISHDNRGRVGGAGEGWRELLVGARTRAHTEVEPQQASHRSVSFSSSYTVPGTGKTIYCLSDT